MPDLSFILPLVLQSAILPFGVALAVLLARRKTPVASAPLAVALGFFASWLAVFHAQWSLPPRQAMDWMPWIILLAMVGALLAERLAAIGSKAGARLALALAVAALTAWPALPSLGPEKTALTIAAAGALIWLAWSVLARAARNRPTPAVLLTVVAGGAGLAIMLDASQMIGQLSGALAAAVGASAVLALARGQGGLCGAAVGVASLVLGALLLMATIYAGFPLEYALLLAGGLLADAVLELVLRRRTPAWLPAAALSAIPVAIALGLALKAAQESGGY